MMRKIIILICLSFVLNISAQETLDDFTSFKTDRSQEYDATNAVFKLSFLFPAVGAEIRLAEKFSLDFSGRLRINAGVNIPPSGPTSVLVLSATRNSCRTKMELQY